MKKPHLGDRCPVCGEWKYDDGSGGHVYQEETITYIDDHKETSCRICLGQPNSKNHLNPQPANSPIQESEKVVKEGWESRFDDFVADYEWDTSVFPSMHKEVKSFISQLIVEAVAEERKATVKQFKEMFQEHNRPSMRGSINDPIVRGNIAGWRACMKAVQEYADLVATQPAPLSQLNSDNPK